jgi:sugar transferase (PEP-CTERM/EpsH1 system associated)
MKLLFLTHRIPYPPNKGDKIRSFHELCAFVARGHEVHLLAFADEARDLRYQAKLAELCASATIIPLDRRWARLRALSHLFTRAPLSLGYFGSHSMRRAVNHKLLEVDFDAVFVYSSTMAQYVPGEFNARTVVDLVDIDSEKWRDYAYRTQPPMSWLYELEAQRLRQYEHAIVMRFAHTILTTKREAALLKDLDEFTRRARLHTITNGIDLQRYQPEAVFAAADVPESERRFLADLSTPRLVFTGAMDYYANVEGVRYFANEVFPLIRARTPRVEFLIVGSNPTGEVRRLGDRVGVTVTGSVEDVRPYLATATVCVVPLRIARGVQNKILEAMAAGRAVIATPEAVAGLRVADGEQALIGRAPQELADAVLKLIEDESLRLRLGTQARRFVEEDHDWTPLLERLTDLVESVGARGIAAEAQWRDHAKAWR